MYNNTCLRKNTQLSLIHHTILIYTSDPDPYPVEPVLTHSNRVDFPIQFIRTSKFPIVRLSGDILILNPNFR